jgi:membrane-bound metal-dependent hydrolase YbcI (DUF457 family)
MDPVLHLLLPVLFLLAMRIDTRKVLMFAPLAIFPDFDAVFELHRAVFHSFIPILVLPIGLIVFSKLKRPEWMLRAMLVQFFLASHIVLDLGGVAFLWPFVKDQLFFDPVVNFNLQGGVNFIIHFDYGWRPYVPMATTDFVSETGFAMIFLGMLVGIVFRKEAWASIRRTGRIVRTFFTRRA